MGTIQRSKIFHGEAYFVSERVEIPAGHFASFEVMMKVAPCGAGLSSGQRAGRLFALADRAIPLV